MYYILYIYYIIIYIIYIVVYFIYINIYSQGKMHFRRAMRRQDSGSNNKLSTVNCNEWYDVREKNTMAHEKTVFCALCARRGISFHLERRCHAGRRD